MKKLNAVLTVLCLFSGQSIAADTDQTAYIAVRSVLAFDRRSFVGKDNVAPWERERTEREKPTDGSTQIVVSNSCGFAEFTYDGLSLVDFLVARDRVVIEQKVLVPLDEWCRVGQYTFGAPTLLGVRTWQGARYLVSSTPIFRDDKGRPYIAEISFIDRAGWATLRKEIDPLATWVCAKQGQMRSGDWERFQRNSWLKETADGYCYSHGVYLEDVASSGGARHDND